MYRTSKSAVSTKPSMRAKIGASASGVTAAASKVKLLSRAARSAAAMTASGLPGENVCVADSKYSS